MALLFHFAVAAVDLHRRRAQFHVVAGLLERRFAAGSLDQHAWVAFFAQTLRIVAADLKAKFGIDTPRIAVLGLNPHAGEDGHLGRDVVGDVPERVAGAVEDHNIALSPAECLTALDVAVNARNASGLLAWADNAAAKAALKREIALHMIAMMMGREDVGEFPALGGKLPFDFKKIERIALSAESGVPFAVGALKDDKQFGLETMCVGGGQGMAMIIERLS